MVEIEEEHPIPQQISSYQFRLVGDMTLKQFFQVAAGAIVSLILYSTNILGPVKWFLIILSFLTGVAFAFFPLQDRPLSKWISLFIQAIYSPTIFLWKKNYTKPNYYAPEPSEGLPAVPLPQTPPPDTQIEGGKEKPLPPSESEKLEKSEKEYLEKIEKQLEGKNPPLIKTENQTNKSTASTQGVQNATQKGGLNIPQNQGVGVEKNQNIQERSGFSQGVIGLPLTPIPSSGISKNAQSAQFSQEAAPPESPETPNLIVGQTLSPNGSIIDNAILEIRDLNGRPVRALKSNKLGHFRIATALPNGDYQILIEKDGFAFSPTNISLKGKIVEPIIIKASGLQSTQPAV